MRGLRLAIAAAAGVLISGAAFAQPPQRGGGFGGGFGGFGGRGMGGMAVMLTFNKQLQDELKMDKEQLDKLNEVMAKSREGLGDLFAKLRDASPEERADMVKKMTEANTKAVNSVLKPEQQKRLQQIENQQAGIGMYLKEDVQKTLKLTDEQKTKIETINSDLQKDLRKLRGGRGFGGLDQATQRKRQSLQKEASDNVAGLLTDSQKETVKTLIGEPFELRQGGFGIGGGGPGGGGGGFGGGVAQPGQVLSTATQNRLRLTDEQKKQLQELQKDVDGKLEKILTEEQRKQLKDMGQGPGRGRRGGRGGADGPGGQP